LTEYSVLRFAYFFLVELIFMPLLTVSGIPLSGKTQRAKEIGDFLEKYLQENSTSIKNVVIINEESLSINKVEAYINANSEKKARGAILSAVERHLTREDLVICDSLNYIKGFRYQLYCIARGIGTPVCTLYCGMNEKTAIERNVELLRYDPKLIANLCSRYEEPDGRNRWDAPLFIVISEDPPLVQGSEICTKIVDALVNKKAPAPNLSTVVTPLLETNYLHEFDKTTTAIINYLIDAQKEGRQGLIKIPNSDISVCLPSRNVTLSEFRRIKRQFSNINKTHTMLDMKIVSNTFSEYLNTTLL
jgi:protein KTI12